LALENKLLFIAPTGRETISYDSGKYLDCASFTYTFPGHPLQVKGYYAIV